MGKGELAGRRAVVTGASRGIGAAVARALARDGAEVLLVARSADAVAELADDIVRDGGRATGHVADLSLRADVEAVARAAGLADILVNNAAMPQKYVPFTTADDEYWRAAFEVNFWAPLLLMQELGRSMAARGHGAIINISSMAAIRPFPFLAHYSAAKAALDMLTRTAAMELGRHGVRAVSIVPGAIATGHHGMAASDQRMASSPVGRIGQPEDIAELAAFLASDRASFITGELIASDGGSGAGYYHQYDRLRAQVQDGPGQ